MKASRNPNPNQAKSKPNQTEIQQNPIRKPEASRSQKPEACSFAEPEPERLIKKPGCRVGAPLHTAGPSGGGGALYGGRVGAPEGEEKEAIKQ